MSELLIKTLHEERLRTWEQAKAMLDTAANRGRDLSATEEAEYRRMSEHIDAIDARVTDLIDARKRAETSEAAFAELMAKPVEGRGVVDGNGRLALPADLSMAEMRALHQAMRDGSMARIEVRDTTQTGFSATHASKNFSGGAYLDRNRLSTLFTVENATSPVSRVYKTTTSATANTVSEGSQKPDSGLVTNYTDVTAQKIATRTRISAELMSDFPAFVSQIGNELSRAVVAKENGYVQAAILTAVSGAADTSHTGTDGVDAAADGVAALQALGIEPTAIVVSPGRLATMRKSVASTAGTYVFDPTSASPQTLHGLRVVAAPQVADTDLFVGDWASACRFFIHDGLSVQLGYDSDDFSKNMRTVLAEERIGFAVVQAARIFYADLT